MRHRGAAEPLLGSSPAEIRVLLLEDDPNDRELVEQELRRSLPRLRLTVAFDEETFLDALRAEHDLVLVDYSVPGYGGMPALRAVQERSPRTPVIIVTGSLDEETAADVIKAGAADYVLKERLARLGPAVASALDKRRILEEKETATSALRESEERYSLAVRGANDGIWDWDLRNGTTYFSPRWRSMLGGDEGRIGARIEEWFDRVHPSDLPMLRAALRAHLEGELPHLEVEHRVRHADGDYRWMLARGLAVRDAAGVAYRLAGSQTDVSRRKAAEERLVHAALHDALTGLPNRALFWDRLRQAIGRARRGHGFAVLSIDLDQFKLVNDSLGHVVGDELLRHLGRRFEDCMRPGDTIARLGGDEFAALVEDLTGSEDAMRLAERLHDEMRLPLHPLGHELRITASIGIVADCRKYDRPEDLVRDADTAMYRAKRLGRGRSRVFDASMHELAAWRLKVETDLWQAVERQELRLLYQPIVELCAPEVNPGAPHWGLPAASRLRPQTPKLAGWRLCGFEALLRWDHPQRGRLLPEQFIALAEETGAIVAIGRWAMREACRAAAGWNHGQDVTVSVNVSARQFSHDDVHALVCDALERSGLPAGRLRLELTETAMMEDPSEAAGRLRRLKALGVGLAIDDFGTGYSSLSQLSRFPIDALKIDRSFVMHMSARPEEEQIVRTIMALAEHLGVATVAEGVETEHQRRRLEQMGCRYAQGYLFAHPLEPPEVQRLIEGQAESVAAIRPRT